MANEMKENLTWSAKTTPTVISDSLKSSSLSGESEVTIDPEDGAFCADRRHLPALLTQAAWKRQLQVIHCRAVHRGVTM